MSYPSFKQSIDSTMSAFDNLIVDRASDGSVRSRSLSSRARFSFGVLHTLTLAERDTLLTFYNAHRAKAFDFVWTADKKTYRCVFEAVPEMSPIKTSQAIVWRCESRLLEV